MSEIWEPKKTGAEHAKKPTGGSGGETATPCDVCPLPAVFFVGLDAHGRTRFCGEHFYTVYKMEAVPTARRETVENKEVGRE